MLEMPKIMEANSQLTAAIRLTIPKSEMPRVMGPGLAEIRAVLAAQNLSPAGPWLTHHLRIDPAVFDFEIAVPVATPVVATGRVVPGSLPGGRLARTIYIGPYPGLGAAWGEFRDWIAANRFKKAGTELWECYLSGPQVDPADCRTELSQPLLPQDGD